MATRWLGSLAQGGALLAVAGVLAGCTSSAYTTSMGAPPTVVCGRILNDTAAGAVLFDATRTGTFTLDSWTAGGKVFLQTSKKCRAGANVTITPASAMLVYMRALAKDGRTAALVLVPRAADADVHITRTDGTTTTVQVRLAGCHVTAGGCGL